MRKIFLIFCFFPVMLFAQSISIIPEPVSLKVNSGSFLLESNVEIVADADQLKNAEFLSQFISEVTSIKLPVEYKASKAKTIQLKVIPDASKNPESYSIRITPQTIIINAADGKGIFYGVQSLRQLLPYDAADRLKVTQCSIPCLEIEDYPQLGWRGIMLDVSRTFMNVNLVKRYLDLMSLYKLNTLHWHLTDDQGWRVEIKQYPLLTKVGSRFDEEFNVMGGYYTQDEIRDVVRYAAERNITIVPEIEMPGHCLAALVAYPHLSCTGEQYKIHTFLEGTGIHDEIYCAGNEQVYEFLEGVLTEVCELFPSKYIHVGGDEAPKVFWKKCPKCQKAMRDNNLKSENELQGYFIQRALKMLEKKGRYVIGWDEIIEESDMPLEVAGTCWRSKDFVARFAEKGHKVVANSTIPYYFDYGYDANSSQRVYENNPIPDNLSADKRANVLGVQANFWSHIDRGEARVDRMLFPRLLSLAGAAWSPVEQKNWARFSTKLEEHKKRLKAMHVNYFDESTLTK